MSPLITDLSYILVVASIVTIIFKRLKQPLVLGYIVAGFLAGPHMTYTPSVSSIEGIEEWSDIGVIFLMFTLGLEFSFKKIVRMGMQPILTAIMVMGCMIGVGGMVASFFGWSSMDELFLGGMLSMSSTTIIYKAFDDLGIRSKPFASGVISVLILEDILGILLMVMLSALAVSRTFEGTELIKSLLELAFFLMLWFMVGIYLVPLIFRKAKRYINKETLLVVSVGLCFLLAVSASEVGYSPAFGAFMMGSILAETLEAENIEKSVSSLRDLFGAVFFVSVGMMVELSVLIEYWLPILVLTLAIILGQMFFGSLSFFVTSGDVKTAVSSGFSMVQIGEFAFIIAGLGQELGVTSQFLYPVVVAVSIITTFLTPYSIKLAPKVSARIEPIFNSRIEERRKKSKELAAAIQQSMHGYNFSTAKAWRNFITAVFYQTAAFLTISTAVTMFCYSTILPVCQHTMGEQYGLIVCCVITLLLLSPSIRAITVRKNRNRNVHYLRGLGGINRLLIELAILLKVLIGFSIVYNVVEYVSPLWWVWNMLMSVAILALMIASRGVKYVSIRMERTFKQNLRQREQQAALSYSRKLRGKDLQIARVSVPQHSRWGGKSLAQLHFGKTDRVHIVAIIRAGHRINIPGGSHRIYPGDELEVVAGTAAIETLRARSEQELLQPEENVKDEHSMSIISVHLSESSPLIGKTLQDADFRTRYHSMVLGIENEQGHLDATQAKRQFRQGDIVWVVGEEADLSMLSMVI
ncbi:MAG: cation:proton antiporter [Bacteroidaceae bacterium]|nr:cation:proton antiporter [Bacteroidaceae bacterium]